MNLLERMYQSIIGGRVFSRRVDTLCEHFAKLLPENATILDVGCGNGLIARRLQHHYRPDVTIRGIDVLLQEEKHIPIEQFDGETFPCEDDTYDVVMFVDVLHHTENQEALLREAIRVARKGVLIKDHPRNGFLAGPTLRFMDWVANRKYGMPLPFNYWTREKWMSTFEELGLKIQSWNTRLGLYRPLGCLFGRQLHFISYLEVSKAAGIHNLRESEVLATV